MCLFHRALAEINLISQENAARTDLPQIALFGRFAGECDSLIASPGQHVDRDAADAAGCAGDNNGTLVRRLPVLLHAMNRQRRRVTRRADLHNLQRRQSFGDFDEALAVDTGIFRVTAINGFAQAAAIDEHIGSGLKISVFRTDNDTRQIDAAIQRVTP